LTYIAGLVCVVLINNALYCCTWRREGLEQGHLDGNPSIILLMSTMNQQRIDRSGLRLVGCWGVLLPYV
jgi:hypothetical protein